ncbi:hypothetical protein SAMN02745130_02155 [Thiothrix eikelboomii]|uniref:Uncharacterized protein n=1 Tax=Thiothrix eikelboomii TaxID=92487 RepID=A0A1T4WUN3_9GAMM|nr:hypothetical protein SAMN02745130_02155 [Thiothrix eikelboomii]
MLSQIIRDLNLTLKPYGLKVVELLKEEPQNPRSSAVLSSEPPVPEPDPEPQTAANLSKRERLMRLMSNRA